MTSTPPATPAQLAPGSGVPAANDALGHRIVAAFTEILLEDKSAEAPCFLDRIFNRAQPHLGVGTTPPDVLLADLLLFENHRVPQYSNLFCAACGMLTEKLIIRLFELTRPEDVDASNAKMDELGKRYQALKGNWNGRAPQAKPQPRKKKSSRSQVAKEPVWKKADFIVRDGRIVECKYRFNSYEGKEKQIRIAEVYRALGYAPVFLHLSTDFRDREKFEDKGWIVYSGQEMLDFIKLETGFDLRDLLSRVSAQPIVRQRILDAHDEWVETQKARLQSSYFYAPDEIRTDFVQAFSKDPRSMTELAETIEKGPDPSLRSELLRDHVERLCDSEMQRLPPRKYDALLGILLTLEEAQRAELLTDAMKDSSPTIRAEVASIYG